MRPDVCLEESLDLEIAKQSGRGLKLDNGQVFSSFQVAYDETKLDGLAATSLKLWRLLL